MDHPKYRVNMDAWMDGCMETEAGLRDYLGQPKRVERTQKQALMPL